jgi:tetratricopeptide (TPR) repeat protein
MYDALWRLTELMELTSSDEQVRRDLSTILSTFDWESWPPPARPYVLVAGIHAWIGDVEVARSWMSRYRSEVPADRQSNNQFDDMVDGFILAREGNFDEALRRMEAGYAEAGCIRCFQDVMGLVYMAAGEPEKAIASFEKFTSAPQLYALTQNAAMVGPALEWLAELYQQQGETDLAIATLTRLVDRWKTADPELQPRVRAAEQQIEELLLQQTREPAATG